ncbi:MAG TPA: PP2C family protein-serine/threonine phosphatase [Spirochaetota bacterium]|nr:PP2C family protein-serine/threonine phosphatase [Spirochaetota bacterium]HPJ37753.1 PP2C family protein-serine/threonine phosphatase [Spirochaetota bacterium]HPQ52856.1 PP2C family protein-serine/threonine phosphatase [Spirochaetota bacterium]
MYYLDLFFTSLVILLYVYYFGYNIIKRFSYTINKLLTLTTFLSLVMFSSLMFQLVAGEGVMTDYAGRIYFGAFLFVLQTIFHFSQMFPQFEKQSPPWLVLVTAIPGIAVIVFTVAADFVIARTMFNNNVISYTFGEYSYVYFICVALYLLGIIAVFIYKYNSIENDAFKNQLFMMFSGVFVGTVLIFLFTLYLPFRQNEHTFKHLALIFSSILIGGIFNYALSDVRILDFKRFYLKTGYSVTIFLLLFFPAYFILDFSMTLAISGYVMPPVGISLLLFLYLFLFYRFARPPIQRLFKRTYLQFESKVNEFFQDVLTLSEEQEQSRFWDYFFKNIIITLEERFDIRRAAFYILNSKEREFNFSFGFGEKTDIQVIREDNPIVKCLNDYRKLIEISLFITDHDLQKYRRILYTIFKNNDIRVIVPFINKEGALIGILFLGALKSEKPYSVDLLSVLDIYRIQLENILSNAIMIENVKSKQVIEHDRLVVSSVKKKLIPRELKSIEGLRISSFYMNNSHLGGDYFESLVLPDNKLGFFITDTSDLGIDSAVIALELYTVLHNQPEKYETPDKMLNGMNWVVSTSRFSEKYARSMYCVYDAVTSSLTISNAAYNSVVLFNPANSSFMEFDTKGIPIGIDRNFNYETKTIELPSGSIGFVYSDGLTSAMNSEGNAYQLGRIKDILRGASDDTAAVLTRKIFDDFKNFSEGVRHTSDVSGIVFKVV